MKEEIERAAQCIRNGGILLYPSDTVWALGCDATNDEAVQKLIDLKKGSEKTGLIVLVERDARLNRHIAEIPSLAWDLIDLAESPLTIVYPESRGLSAKVTAADGSVAIRMIRDEFCERLINKANCAIVSTSANISDEPAPNSFQDINPVILEGVDYAVNLQRTARAGHSPSRIIKLQLDGEIQIIR